MIEKLLILRVQRAQITIPTDAESEAEKILL